MGSVIGLSMDSCNRRLRHFCMIFGSGRVGLLLRKWRQRNLQMTGTGAIDHQQPASRAARWAAALPSLLAVLAQYGWDRRASGSDLICGP